MQPQPTRAAALDRIAAIRPRDYERTRNHLEGAVSGLSPYITHGLVTLREVLAGVNEKTALSIGHKFVYELGWREFFRHVWALRGGDILNSLWEGPLPDEAYTQAIPADVRTAATGVAVIDEAVRTLYATGGLHNHARMWLASYLVHLRRVHWRAGADWMVAHLLDGDLASNHLSWQWVAGTASHKPYLFNAENVARYAPRHWHSAGTAIDKSYAELEAIARGGRPAVMPSPKPLRGNSQTDEPTPLHEPPGDLEICASDQAPPVSLGDREVWLVHPWALRAPPDSVSSRVLVMGIYPREFHQQWAWSESRWRWVDAAMSELTPHRWFTSAPALAAALSSAASVHTFAELHITHWFPGVIKQMPQMALFPAVNRQCTSFSQWWTRATKGLQHAADLL